MLDISPVPPAAAALTGSCGLSFKRTAPAAAGRPITCLECDGPGRQAGDKRREFCSAHCRNAWHKRRRDRGAELYDFVMAMRHERALAARLVIGWSLLCRLASAYRDADVARRGGRRSWRRPSEALGDIPNAYGSAGDNR